MIKLAIIIPYYKIDFFEKTIKSVAEQTNKNFVLYIGNDASPEPPLPIIEKYFTPNEYHYFGYTENIGGKNLALQWERILENVHEEWFEVLGDDDVMAPNFVEEFYKSIQYCNDQNIHCIKTVHHHIDEYGNLIRINDYNVDSIEAYQLFINKYCGVASSSLSENIFKTKMYRKYGFEKIPLAWGSDDLAILTFSDYGTIYYNRATYIKVRLSNLSISGSENLNKNKDDAYNILREKFILHHSKMFPSEFVGKVIKQYLEYCYMTRQDAKYSVATYFLKNFSILNFFKTLKKIYYINSL